MNRILIVIIAVTLCFEDSSSLAKNALNEKISLPISFDFGSEESLLEDDALLIRASTIYLESIGYGLISTLQVNYKSRPERKNLDRLKYDGIRSDSKIIFRVDVAPGEYWIEVFMDGGQYNIWHGKILVNNNLLIDSLYAYTASFEGEDPPVYWTFLKKVTVTENYILISIKALNQSNTLAGVNIYPHTEGDLKLSGSSVGTTNSFLSPNADLALRLINAGQVKEAQRIIDPIPENLYPLEKASLLLALAGRLETENPRSFLVWASTLLNQVTNPQERSLALFNKRIIELYLDADQWYKMAGWDWATHLTRSGIFTRLDLSGFAYQKIAEIKDHPLSNQALFQLGKLCFWGWVEQHDKRMHKLAKNHFSELLTFYPQHQLLLLYSGENQALPKVTETDYARSPPWAYYASQALKHTVDAIHYWVNIRQADNGEFGGKYDDDVEMLRWWPIARLAVNDQTTLTGLQRLVDGIWHSDWIVNGFSAKVRDVEHAAEPVADTQPMMIGLDYGNPVYVERCMESIKGLKDLWTGINAKGHRHFKSSWYSSTAIDDRPPRDCDLPMNARTVKAARWLAWYNRHPVAMQFLREWADAWLEDCLRTDKGKPYGIVPSAIRYEDDAIGGHADNWYAPGMFWRYFDFHGGTQMLQQFLVTYDLTGDDRYLQPVELAIKLLAKYDEKIMENMEPGNEEWVVDILRKSPGFAQTIEKYRLLTGNSEFDDLLLKYGSDYLKFRLKGDLTYIEEGHKHTWEGIINNEELMTSEGYFTDRIEIGDIHRNQIWGTSHLESCYTGNSLSEGFYPFYAVTWKGLNDNFAALVTAATAKNLNIWAHNLDEKTQEGEISFWRLEPGKFLIEQGTDKNNDGIIDEILKQEEIEIVKKPSSWQLTLPGRTTQIISVRQKEAWQKESSNDRADLALVRSDIELSRAGEKGVNIKILLHNIGIKEASNFDVALNVLENSKLLPIAKERINLLEAPLDLDAKIREIEFSIKDVNQIKGEVMISADPADTITEITEINNQVIIPRADILKMVRTDQVE